MVADMAGVTARVRPQAGSIFEEAERRGDTLMDCPECQSAGSVSGDICEVCYAELGEFPGVQRRSESSLDLLAEMGFLDRRLLHPSIPLRFVDVIAELERIAAMAGGSSAPSPAEVRTACRRAQSLLWVLRRQFLQDVCLPPTR
jgi:hypothetical protein